MDIKVVSYMNGKKIEKAIDYPHCKYGLSEFWKKSKFPSSLLHVVLYLSYKIFPHSSLWSILYFFQGSSILYISGFKNTCKTSSFNSDM